MSGSRPRCLLIAATLLGITTGLPAAAAPLRELHHADVGRAVRSGQVTMMMVRRCNGLPRTSISRGSEDFALLR